MHAEVKALRVAKVERQVGGVYFEGSWEDAWLANRELRTAVRVLLRLARFQAGDEVALYEGARAIDWGRYVRPEGTLIVDAQSKESMLEHTRFVEQRVKDAIVDGFRERTGTRPSVGREGAELGVHVHLFRDRCTVSVDTSGEALHRRGWRREQGRAPLAETLAAAVVALSGWDGRSPFLDPFCGSGTLLVEAAWRARGWAAGRLRRFGYERWPLHDAARHATWSEARAGAERRGGGKLILQGFDRDPEALAAARANVRSAEVEDACRLDVADARTFAPRPGWNGWIVSNLPYGKRVGEGEDLGELYHAFGTALREHCGGYHVALLCAKDRVRRQLGLKGLVDEVELTNGGIDCVLLRGRLPEG